MTPSSDRSICLTFRRRKYNLRINNCPDKQNAAGKVIAQWLEINYFIIIKFDSYIPERKSLRLFWFLVFKQRLCGDVAAMNNNCG